MNTVTEIVDTVSNHSMTNVSNKTANGSRRLQSDSMNNILSNQKRFGTSNSNKKDNSNSLTYNSGDKKLFSFNPKLSVQWYVGGAHVVDKTFLAWHPSATFNPSNWKAYLETNSFEDHGLDAAIGSQHHHQREKFPLLASSILSGESRWFSNKEMDFETSRFDALPDSSNALFSSTIDFKSLNLTSHLTSGRYWLVAWSVVDQDFAQVNQGFPANSGPQSYYSNIRTKSQFSCESIGEKDCHGKRYWPSDFIEIEIHREASSSDGNKNDYFVKVVDSVKHCAWWEYQSLKNIKGTIPKMNNKDLSATNHEIEIEVEESYFFLSFERGYIILFLSVLFVICMVSMIASYWRRLRVYSTVLNNRYLNLPTGFVRV